MKSALRHTPVLWLLLTVAAAQLTGCNEKEEDTVTSEPDQVTKLTLTVNSVTDGQFSWSPKGNVYLFYSEEARLDYATADGDGTLYPLVDVSQRYNPVVHYQKDGQMRELRPVSAYGTVLDGQLDLKTTTRYAQITFDLTRLSTTYGTVGKGSTVLVLIALDDAQTRAWTAHGLTLRRDYVIHVSLPDRKDVTYVRESEQNSRWWQVEGDE